MNKELKEEIVWSKGRTREEMVKQTLWSSSKDWSGLSGLKFHCYSHNNDVQIINYVVGIDRRRSFFLTYCLDARLI